MKKFFSYLLIISIIANSTAFAKSVNLHTEPKAESKTLGTVDPEAGVTIVYTPKNSEWIKVANPTNGDVGWIKSSELGKNHYNVRVVTSDKGNQTYKVFQFGSDHSQYSQEQIEKEMQRFQEHQQMVHKQIAHMFNDLFYFQQPFLFSQPIFVPVVMVPENANPKHASTTQPAEKTQKS